MLSRLINFLATEPCELCKSSHGPVCGPCASTNFVPRAPHCFECGILSAGGQTCESCLARYGYALDGAIVPYRLEGMLQTLLHRYKYGYDRSLGKYFAELIAPQVMGARTRLFDVISFVPSDGDRQRERGFNPARAIARQLSLRAALPCRELLLRTQHRSQVGSSRRQRFEQVRGNFLSKNADLTGQRVLLVDDVMTTGATLDECARLLKADGAREVWAIVVAKH